MLTQMCFILQGDHGQRGLMGESGPRGEQVRMRTRARSRGGQITSLCIVDKTLMCPNH